MKRLRFKIFLWSVLLISVFLKNVEPSSIFRREKAIKSTTKPQVTNQSTTVTVNLPRVTTSKPNSARNTPRPKVSSRRTTTIPPTSSVPSMVLKQHGSASSSSVSPKKTTLKPSTTTLSPMEVMNRLYQMHGMASHGVSASHSSYYSPTTTKKKEDQKASSSMDDIYRLHALAISQGSSHVSKKPSSSHGSPPHIESSSSTEKTSSNPQNLHPKQNSMEHIYQQHSSLPSSMHHIMAQHSQQSSSSKKPEKTSSQEPSGSSLSNIMQPLLKQLTPVGAGIGVVLAPLLLFSGFLQFFSNMSSFLNNFAQTILPVRRPSLGQTVQNQNSYFQNLGGAHLKRQPREWMMHPGNMEKLQEFTDLFLKAMKEAEMQ